MHDHPHLRYLNHCQQERLKLLNQDLHDLNPTCKHAFLDLDGLSRFS